MLDYRDENLINGWLDNSMNHAEAFVDLLSNTIPIDLLATPITGARDLTATSEGIEIKSDY